MTARFADLHIHTHYSDGTMSPEEVVQAAKDFGLAGIAIADHDTTDGVAPAITSASEAGIEVIAGVELSSEYCGKDIHILGYCFNLDPAASPLVRKLRAMQDTRMERMKKMIRKLGELGVRDIVFEDISDQVRSDSVGRLHLAKLLVARGHVNSVDQAFEKYLGEGAPAYYPKFKQTPDEAIRLIKDAGGVAVLAHPMLTQRDELIPRFVAAGLDGIEAYYPNCSMDVVDFYKGIAKKYSLLVTGGSDAHGEGKKNTHIGKARVLYEYVELLKQRARR